METAEWQSSIKVLVMFFSSNLKKYRGPQSFEECQKKKKNTDTQTHKQLLNI